MRTLVSACALVVGVTVAVQAQDSTEKSRTQVKADHGAAVVIVGCLRPGADGFVLTGAVASAGKELNIESKKKTDVDKDDKTVTDRTKAEVEHGDHEKIGTSGAVSEYIVSPQTGVDLASHVNERVEIAAIRVDPKKGDGDAKFKIREETKTEKEHAPDTKATSNDKLEVPRGPVPRLVAMSVKRLAPTCSGR